MIVMLSVYAATAAGNMPPFTTSVSEDTTYVKTWQEMMNEEFIIQETEVINLDIKDHPSWLKIDLPPLEEELYLHFESPMLDSVFFYHVGANGLIYGDTTGVAFPFSSRQENSPHFLFRVGPTEAASTAMLRIQSGKQVITVVTLDTKYEHSSKQSGRDIFFGFYSGLMLVMFLYNLFVYFSVRDKSYLYYVLHILFVCLTQLVLNGYGSQYVWQDNTWIAMRATHYSGVLSGTATILFAAQFLQVKIYAKWLYKLCIFFIGMEILAFVLATVGIYRFSFNLINANALFSLILIVGAFMVWRKGYKPGLYFLGAWTVFLLGVTVFVLKDFGIFPYNDITRFALPVGSAIEVVLLSLALADRINVLKREKEAEQEKRLKVLKENERIIKQQNVLLEKKVDERTKELADSNKELNQTLTELRSTQAQLVDAEKMASLGQMTAGIAHELNNPINFVSSNITPLKRDLDDLFEIIDEYEGVDVKSDEAKEKLEKAKALSKELELDFLKAEINQLMKGINDGASRTAEIVKGLRIFSRLDEDALKKADINECIRSTAVILKSTIKSEAPLIQELADGLPEINCYPGKLNQVIMNIIANALQATAASGKPYEERFVKVVTEDDGENLVIRIIDNGTGMTDEVKAKIFDPFFTTKKVGQGTGLGLSIVLGIINDHKGTIDVKSELGEGTEFIITLSKGL